MNKEIKPGAVVKIRKCFVDSWKGLIGIVDDNNMWRGSDVVCVLFDKEVPDNPEIDKHRLWLGPNHLEILLTAKFEFNLEELV